MSTFQIFPNFGRGGGVIENQFFPKFKIVHIILGGGGSRKLWTFSTICEIFYLECSPYRCMPNMATSIARHNLRVLGSGDSRTPPCNCEGGAGNCPVQGACRQDGVVYEACVQERVSGRKETYTGLTGRRFRDRWKEHERNFEKPNQRNETSLSLRLHVWELKDRGIDYDISSKILDRAKTFNPATKKCNLCTREKYFIMYVENSSTLNKRSEVFNTCRHRTQSLLEKVK